MMNVRKVYLGNWSVIDCIVKLGSFIPVPDKSIGERFLQTARQGSGGCVACLLTEIRQFTSLHMETQRERLPRELE
jgi:hypothetical protein